MERPKLRPLRGFPMPAQTPDGKQHVFLGLADSQQISPKIVATAQEVRFVLPLMDGTRGLDQIVAEIGRGLQRPFLEQLVAQLDDAGLIFGPTFDALMAKMRADFDASETLPPGSTAQVADALVMQKYGEQATEAQKLEHGGTELAAMLDRWIDASLKSAPDPSFDALPAAVVAPHVDYMRGWMNYAQIWGRLRVADRPDRVLILGTNHFGQSTGVCACNKGYESPIGVSPVAGDLLAALQARLGSPLAERVLEHRYDHEREHSIELQIPWIQHCLGRGGDGGYIPVLGILIHDPAVNNGESYDGNGVGFTEFVGAMEGALADVGGRTLIVCSADLSHCGPAFGDQVVLSGETAEGKAELERITSHDREMVQAVLEGRGDDLVSSMAWQQNPTRWCSVGALVAALKLAKPTKVRLLNYVAAVDQQGTTLVSHAAMVMTV